MRERRGHGLVWALVAALGPGLALAARAQAAGPRCLTATPPLARGGSATRPAVLFVAPEVHRSLAAGSKQVLLRGEVPPPGVEALARVVEEGYRRIVAELGFAAFPDRISVSFAELPAGIDGYAVEPYRTTSAEIVLSRGLAGAELLHALAHQLGHLASAPYAREDSGWWAEATAEWLAGQLDPVADSLRFAVLARLAAPAEALTTEGAPGGSTWPAFLAARYGGEVIRRIWEEVAAGTGVMKGSDAVLGRLGSSLRREAELYAAWLLTESRRRNLPDAVSWATAGGSIYPLRDEVSVAAPDTLGIAFLRFDLAEVAGGLRIALETEGRPDWTALALLVPVGASVPTARTSFVRESDTRAAIAVPSASFSEVVVAVINLGSGGRLPFSAAAAADDRFPFDLVEVAASAEGERVRLSWTTASEVDVHGWSVLRSATPAEGFAPVHRVLIPGAGVAGSAAGSGSDYVLIDDGVEAGRTYYYYLEARTGEGLPAPSQVISVSIPR